MKVFRLCLHPVCLCCLLVLASFTIATDAFAQKGVGLSIQQSFICGQCPAGFTPLGSANWNVCFRQDPQGEQGLIIRNACFKNQQVLFQMTQPFVFAPYHDPANHRFKDGITPRCGGVSLAPLGPTTAAVGPDDENPGFPATADFPGSPAYQKIEIATTLNAFNYRYRQRYVFHDTGDIDAMFGFGGFLLPFSFNVSHLHTPYWRLDFDLDDFRQNFVEQFGHPLQTDTPPGLLGPDTHTPVLRDGPLVGDTNAFQKWTVRSNTMNAQGKFHSWEIEPLLGHAGTEMTSADVWAVVVNDLAPEEGAEVGAAACNDVELTTVYSKGIAIDQGADLVMWVNATAHHEPRENGEEGGGQPFNLKRMPGHEWLGIRISPRNFVNTTP